MLGGRGNGDHVPKDWEPGAEYEYGGSDDEPPSRYSQRKFYRGDVVYYVWANVEIHDQAVWNVMHWHSELLLGNQVDAQKELLQVSMTSAAAYTNIVLAVGYAALFTMWTQTKGGLTPATTLWAGIFLALSVLLFVGWEISQMIYRSLVNFQIARAVGDINLFAERMRAVQELTQAGTRRMFVPWLAVLGTTALLAVIGFVIMLSGMMHGAWLAFVADSLRRVGG